MNIPSIMQAIFTWIRGAVSETPGVTVYWDEPQSPRPDSPSVRLSFLTGPTAIGMDERLPVSGDPNKFRLVGSRTMILSINAYGSEALQILSDVQTSIFNPSAVSGLSALKVAVLDTSPPRDITTAQETRIEARTQMDVTLLATEEKVIDLNSIGSLAGSSDIAGIPNSFTAESGGV